jgi:alkylation response protein AidB-like acyl-CoA dehydrogenase
MVTDIRLGDPLLMSTAREVDRIGQDHAMAGAWCSQMLGRVADEAIRTSGAVGVVADPPPERICRDPRVVESRWESASEIRRRTISRELLRPLDT